MAPVLLTGVDSTSHVHLIVGSNPLAGARCARSIEVGAKPIVVAPEDATVHYSLMKRIEDGEVEWIKREFQEGDLTSLGRAEVDGVVDTVFVTVGGKNGQGARLVPVRHKRITALTPLQLPGYQLCAAGFAFP